MIILKRNKFLIFALLSMLVVFSAVPSWAGQGSWFVKKSGDSNTVYYSSRATSYSDARLAAESGEVEIEVKETTPVSNIETLPETTTEVAPSGTVTDAATLVTALEKLTNLETVDLSKAELPEGTALDLSNVTAKAVSVAGTNVSSVTLSSTIEKFTARGCEDLKELSLEGNTSIKQLDVSSTGLTSINANGCGNLESLAFTGCKIAASNVDLTGCEKLQTLNITGNSFLGFPYTKEDLPALTEFSGGNQTADLTWKPSDNSFNMSSVLNGTVANSASAFAKIAATASAKTAASTSDVSKVTITDAYDAEGNKVTWNYNATTGDVEFSDTPVKIAYTYATEFGSDMDVTVDMSSGSTTGGASTGGSGGGCSLGFAAVGLVIALAFFLF